ncbi:ABC transporter permease [Corynebacterium poyangense]|nr:FtsX-like permease family protein [Corynebacterium poyangense]
MSGTVALITFLLVGLSALTGGLAKQNTSALEALNPAQIVIAVHDGSPARFDTSQITPQQQEQWAAAVGVEPTPIGIRQGRLSASDSEAVTYIGLPVGTVIPGGQGEIHAGQLMYDKELTYSHMPVVWTDFATWQEKTHNQQPTALLLDEPVASNHGDIAGTQALSLCQAFQALPAYSSEHGSLLTMQALLYAISALVIVAFLSIWTMQRTRDVAIMRSLGASRSFVLKDALGGAALTIIIGVSIGTIAAAGLMLLASAVVPVQLGLSTILLPAVGTSILGLAAAWLATRRVTTINPLLALGASLS